MVRRSKIQRLMYMAFYLISLMVMILLLLPAVSVDIKLWWLDNLLNLQLQWTLLGAVLIIINLFYIKRWRLISSGLFMMLIFYNLSPLYLLRSAPVIPEEKASALNRLTVAQINLSYDNPNLAKLVPLLGDAGFDLLVIQEASDLEHENINALGTYYPYTFGLGHLEATPSGMAIFSRWPIVEQHLHDLGYKSSHILEVVIQTDSLNTPIQLFTLHPTSPRNAELWKKRNKTLAGAAEIVAHSPFTHQIVIGDFNSSPWSENFKQFEKTTQLKNSAQGFGYLPSWSYSTQPVLKMLSSVYIDQHLVSPAFQVTNKQARTVPGSDHQLIITELAI